MGCGCGYIRSAGVLFNVLQRVGKLCYPSTVGSACLFAHVQQCLVTQRSHCQRHSESFPTADGFIAFKIFHEINRDDAFTRHHFDSEGNSAFTKVGEEVNNPQILTVIAGRGRFCEAGPFRLVLTGGLAGMIRGCVCACSCVCRRDPGGGGGLPELPAQDPAVRAHQYRPDHPESGLVGVRGDAHQRGHGEGGERGGGGAAQVLVWTFCVGGEAH